jgi:hypothetical protein
MPSSAILLFTFAYVEGCCVFVLQALMALPATDFNLCMFLIPERLVSFLNLLLKVIGV